MQHNKHKTPQVFRDRREFGLAKAVLQAQWNLDVEHSTESYK